MSEATSWKVSDIAPVILPRISGTLSMIGSACIVMEVLRNKQKRSKVYHRLLLGMSCVDFIFSSSLAVSTLPIPADSGVYGAKGNDATCTLQGFWVQFGLTETIYNTVLAYYFMRVIRYSKTESQMKKVEIYFHLIPLLYGFFNCFLALGLDLYRNASLWCWMTTDPQVFRWVLFYGPLWFLIFFPMVVFYYLTWKKVRDLEKKTAKYSFDSRGSRSTTNEMDRDRKKLRYSTRIAHQAYFYFGAFIISWIWSTAFRLGQLFTGNSNYFLLLMTSFFVPLQGFLNYFVYMRPRYLQYKKKHPKFSFFGICRRVFVSTFCRCCNTQSEEKDLRNSANYFESNTTSSSNKKQRKIRSNELNENPTDMNNDDNIFDSGFSSEDVRSSRSDKNSSEKNNSEKHSSVKVVQKAGLANSNKEERKDDQQDLENQGFTNEGREKETTESQKEMETFHEMFCDDSDEEDDQLSNDGDSAATADSLYVVKSLKTSL